MASPYLCWSRFVRLTAAKVIVESHPTITDVSHQTHCLLFHFVTGGGLYYGLITESPSTPLAAGPITLVCRPNTVGGSLIRVSRRWFAVPSIRRGTAQRPAVGGAVLLSGLRGRPAVEGITTAGATRLRSTYWLLIIGRIPLNGSYRKLHWTVISPPFMSVRDIKAGGCGLQWKPHRPHTILIPRAPTNMHLTVRSVVLLQTYDTYNIL
jgi:hypothetical protein